MIRATKVLLPVLFISICTVCFPQEKLKKPGNSPTSAMQKELTILDNHLKTKRPDFYGTLNPPLTDQQITALEQEFKITLPPQVKLLYKWKNGQAANERFVNNSEFMPLESALETYSILTPMIGHDFEIKNWWNENWIPLFDNGGGDNICVDMSGTFTGNAGQIIEFWHADPDRNVIAPSLEAFIAALNKFYDTTPPANFDEYFKIGEIDGYPKRFVVE
jgi:cell wall assembly regulator SMI1